VKSDPDVFADALVPVRAPLASGTDDFPELPFQSLAGAGRLGLARYFRRDLSNHGGPSKSSASAFTGDRRDVAAMVIVPPKARVNRTSRSHPNAGGTGTSAIPPMPAPSARLHRVHRDT
jgi:hypothetical protein